MATVHQQPAGQERARAQPSGGRTVSGVLAEAMNVKLSAAWPLLQPP
jgi:hypothetical protein